METVIFNMHLNEYLLGQSNLVTSDLKISQWPEGSCKLDESIHHQTGFALEAVVRVSVPTPHADNAARHKKFKG